MGYKRKKHLKQIQACEQWYDVIWYDPEPASFFFWLAHVELFQRIRLKWYSPNHPRIPLTQTLDKCLTCHKHANGVELFLPRCKRSMGLLEAQMQHNATAAKFPPSNLPANLFEGQNCKWEIMRKSENIWEINRNYSMWCLFSGGIQVYCIHPLKLTKNNAPVRSRGIPKGNVRLASHRFSGANDLSFPEGDSHLNKGSIFADTF